jgi:hypothetical protein
MLMASSVVAVSAGHPDRAAAGLAAAPEPLATDPTAASAAAEEAARAYLEARSAAVLPGSDAAPLDELLMDSAATCMREQLVARGKVGCWRALGEQPVGLRSRVDILTVEVDEQAAVATVRAYVYTTVTLRGTAGGSRQEGEGLDHVLSLRTDSCGWHVVDDQYLDTAQPAYLRNAGAPAAVVRRATRRLVDAAARRDLSSLACPIVPAQSGVGDPAAPPASSRALSTKTVTTLSYDRAAAVAYADKWTSEADVTGVSHNGSRYNPAYYDYASNGGPGDCTPYASQCIRAGGYPFLNGWYYVFGSPFAASPSWYNNNPQRTYLNTRYFDKVASVTDLKKGDLIYYDWDANGYLDHTAVYVGIFNGVRCIDAHTTDHRHHSWKLGGAGAKYHFYSIRDSIRWPLANQ